MESPPRTHGDGESESETVNVDRRHSQNAMPSLIDHQLARSLNTEHPPTALFTNQNAMESAVESADETESKFKLKSKSEMIWNGDPMAYRVEMDPFGWRWVLKSPEIPNGLPLELDAEGNTEGDVISCPCSLCQHRVAQYAIKRQRALQRYPHSESLQKWKCCLKFQHFRKSENHKKLFESNFTLNILALCWCIWFDHKLQNPIH